MTAAIDSNVVIALWDTDSLLSSAAQGALDSALNDGPLVIAAPVFAELLASPDRPPGFLDAFCSDAGIQVDWDIRESIWRTAGEAFRSYVRRRRKHSEDGPRRILTDFVIGAHATENGHRLLTLDERLYRAAYPHLKLVRI